MINGYTVYNKINFKLAKLFTLFIRGSFKKCGSGTIFFFPNRFDNPQKMVLGDNVVIYANCWLNVVENYAGLSHSGNLSIGSNCIISYGSQLSACKEINIGNNVGIGKNCVIVDHIHDYTVLHKPILYAPISDGQPVIIEDDVFIGNNSSIAPGVSIGRHSFIGANSVVLSDIPAFCMAAGNPAKVIKIYDDQEKKWMKING